MKLKKYYKKLCILITGVIAFNLSSLMVSANANTLNIKTFMTENQFVVYGMPGSFSRLTYTTSKVHGFYLVSSGINVNFEFKTDNEHIRETLLETCSNGDFLSVFLGCRHWDNSECTNGTISMPSIKHHTNGFNVMNQLPNATTNYAVMLLSPNRGCCQDYKHIIFEGVCWQTLKELIVGDFDYVYDEYSATTHTAPYDYVAYNMVHEIGHLYGVKDHYDKSYGESVDNCIWGLNKNDPDIYKNLTVCSRCLQILKNNKSKFNHTPIN